MAANQNTKKNLVEHDINILKLIIDLKSKTNLAFILEISMKTLQNGISSKSIK